MTNESKTKHGKRGRPRPGSPSDHRVSAQADLKAYTKETWYYQWYEFIEEIQNWWWKCYIKKKKNHKEGIERAKWEIDA